MLAALQTIENPALHLAVHLSMILSLREGEILGLQPSDLDFDAADGRGTISVSKTMQRANKDALEKLDPNQVYHTFPDKREGSKSSLILLPDGLPIAPELLTIGCAFTDLAFNGFFSLAVSGITGIDHGSHGRHLAFFTSVNGGAFIRTNVSYNLYTIFCNEVQ